LLIVLNCSQHFYASH